MASWMVHLRIADTLLDRFPDLAPIEFLMGNLAPDSGIPNENGHGYTPPKSVSHFQTQPSYSDLAAFTGKYPLSGRSREAFSFYLGYLCHLMTDNLWLDHVLFPTKARFSQELLADKQGFYQRMKADWYDLDFRYLRDHPGFRAFRVYLGSVGFRNVYMEEFSADAFDERRAYVTEFYLQPTENLDRVYPYLTEAEMNRFVEDAASSIAASIMDFHI